MGLLKLNMFSTKIEVDVRLLHFCYFYFSVMIIELLLIIWMFG